MANSKNYLTTDMERKQITVVAAIIVNNGLILTTQRGYGKWKGWWEFPGGKVEYGESPEEALRREIMEELDMTVEVGDRLTTVNYDYPEFHLTMHCHWCRMKSGEMKLLEHESAIWLSKEELRKVQWLPADEEVIDLIQRFY